MDVLQKVQENVKFRINSLQAMATGGTSVSQSEPLTRRREIMRRRREAVGALLPGDSGSTTSTSEYEYSSHGGTHSSSGNDSMSISSSNSTPRQSSSTESNIPSMSEANRGTVERARERGFDG